MTASRPSVSVVIVTHGRWALTAKALAALHANTRHAYELIVVDNDSRDETRERLAELSDVRMILNPGNTGFGPAANQGVAIARAPHVLLLNTDAYVHPDWLEPLLEDLEDPVVAAVVPQFRHPDGSLQEAGALLAQDGSVRVYGDGDDPSRGCYRFRRVVDTGGAACMLIRRDVFQSLGGFDPIYAPAYYEDADLCLRIAGQGLNVVYEPRSVVTHERYGSSSRDAAVRLSERGRAIFVERWGARLEGRPWTFRGTTQQGVIAARDARATPRVLVAAAGDDHRAEGAVRAVIEGWPDARATWMTSNGRFARAPGRISAPGRARAPGRGSAPGSGSAPGRMSERLVRSYAPVSTSNGFDAEAWRRRGVEVLDETDASWLGERLFHYDVVLLGFDERSEALETTQPQAARVSLAEVAGAGGIDARRLTAMLASAGVAGARPRP